MKKSIILGIIVVLCLTSLTGCKKCLSKTTTTEFVEIKNTYFIPAYSSPGVGKHQIR